MNIEAITKATKALSDARSALAQAEKDRAAMNCAPRNQDRISVFVNGVNIAVTDYCQDGYSYSHQLIRGREMIALGCIKLLNENIAWHEWNCAQKEMELANLVRPK